MWLIAVDHDSMGLDLYVLCLLVPVFDRDRTIRSSGDMMTWHTSKPCTQTQKSHINFCVFDSTWEASEAFHLDHDPNVAAWVKNDHLGFEILSMKVQAVRLLNK